MLIGLLFGLPARRASIQASSWNSWRRSTMRDAFFGRSSIALP